MSNADAREVDHQPDEIQFHGKLNFLFSAEPIGVRSQLMLDDVALYSVTNSVDAASMATIMQTYAPTPEIADLTACVGGNTIAFSRVFGTVIAIENNAWRYRMLLHNLATLALGNVWCWQGNAQVFLRSSPCTRAYFLDPPWGGPAAVSQNGSSIRFCGREIYEWCDYAFQANSVSIVIGIKLPKFHPEPVTAPNRRHSVHNEFRKMKLVVLIYEPN